MQLIQALMHLLLMLGVPITIVAIVIGVSLVIKGENDDKK